ncbi:hydrogenase expression protein HupH [Aureimonas flava]|uniref:Hydrogenase expression protein HupH n=1 Tax=Aureimonas flava TaxID=2320271 RepID=A0A3A1WEZ9_9HYPH|nr:aspartate/glutamate racemase family protein [Aureimonas flava]RIX98187.1 hydrogenase expression protein HupH [Aureimonas flava]
MRLLLVNPNMTRAMTDTMVAIAAKVAGPEHEIVGLTADRGFPYIASRAESQIAGGIALEMIADNLDGADAVIMAAFGDPGLRGARELFDLPVVGMADAAIMSAAMLGDRFSIVTFSPVMRRWYLDCVRDSGLIDRSAGVRTPHDHPLDVNGVKETLRAELCALARRAVEEDGADVVILGGAPLAGLAQEIAPEVPAIVVDPISAAVAQALALVRIAPGPFSAVRHCKPIAKTSVGLSPSLRSIVGHEPAGG